MPFPTPDISVDLFDGDKWYEKVIQQQGKPVFDCTINLAQDLQRRKTQLATAAALGYNVRVGGGFEVQETAPNVNNFKFALGMAAVGGHVVVNDANISYNDGSPSYRNRLSEGAITNVDAMNDTITDDNKEWVTQDLLDNCRVVMLTGVSAGISFVVQTGFWTSNTLKLNALGGIATGDTYVLLPPALTTPTLDRTDTAYLQLWFDYVNHIEDPDIAQPLSHVPAVQMQKLRWCVRVAENGVTPTSDTASFGYQYMKLATFSRVGADSGITDSIITLVRGVELSQAVATQEIVDARTSDWFDTADSLDDRLDTHEAATMTQRLWNGSFESWPLGDYGSDIPGWCPSSARWFKEDTGTGIEKSAKLVRTGFSAGDESLTSYPFRAYPGQVFKFSAKSRGTGIPWSVTAKLLFFADAEDAPLSTTTLSFGAGSAGWVSQTANATAPLSTAFGYVVLTANNVDGELEFDDIRAELLEDVSGNSGQPYAWLNVLGNDQFAYGMMGWTFDGQKAQLVSIEEEDDDSMLRIHIAAGTDTADVWTWPIDMSSTELRELAFVRVVARYTGVTFPSGVNNGPAFGAAFFDLEDEALPAGGQWFNIAAMNYDVVAGGSGLASPGYPDSWNAYCGMVLVPKGAASMRLHLRLQNASGTFDISQVQVFRVAGADVALNRARHDLAVNGDMLVPTDDANKIRAWEFSRGFRDDGMGGGDAVGFLVHDDTTSKFGTRSAKIWGMQAPTGALGLPTIFKQRSTRILTEQDKNYGYNLSFYYRRGALVNPERTTLLAMAFVRYLDSTGAYIDEEAGTAPWDTSAPGGNFFSVYDLSISPAEVIGDWTFASVLCVPPSGAAQAEVGFALHSSGSLWIDGVRLWSRTYCNPDMTTQLSDDEYEWLVALFAIFSSGVPTDPINVSDAVTAITPGALDDPLAHSTHVHHHGEINACAMVGDPLAADPTAPLHSIAVPGVTPGFVSAEWADILSTISEETLGHPGVLSWAAAELDGVSLLACWDFPDARLPYILASLQFTFNLLSANTLGIAGGDDPLECIGTGYYIFRVVMAAEVGPPAFAESIGHVLVYVDVDALPLVTQTRGLVFTTSGTKNLRNSACYVRLDELWPINLADRPKHTIFLDPRYIINDNGEVLTDHLANDAVTSAKLASSIVTPADRAVGTYHIQHEAVFGAQMARGVGSIAGASLRWFDPGAPLNLWNMAVDCDEVTITSGEGGVEIPVKVKNLGIDALQLKADAVTEIKIADRAVTRDKQAIRAYAHYRLHTGIDVTTYNYTGTQPETLFKTNRMERLIWTSVETADLQAAFTYNNSATGGLLTATGNLMLHFDMVLMLYWKEYGGGFWYKWDSDQWVGVGWASGIGTLSATNVTSLFYQNGDGADTGLFERQLSLALSGTLRLVAGESLGFYAGYADEGTGGELALRGGGYKKICSRIQFTEIGSY